MTMTLEGLNLQQAEAVVHESGPLLILAGAGSGKTRVLTNRVAWLIGERGVKPWNICAITFTNKAAGEMRERVNRMVDFGAEAVMVSTFHSLCVRILRRFIDRIGYENNFVIYDSDDQKSVIKEICRDLQIDVKRYKERMILSRISSAKDQMIEPDEYLKEAGADPDGQIVARCYSAYQSRLQKSNAVDFDDLINLTVRLFRQEKDVLDYYQERYRYIMVDEYQDTNRAQFYLVSLLAEKYRNLCVVGDDDQSIYKFRGADIGNILGFEKVFPDAKVIRLEQNYRSTQTILDAANAVIANNKSRKEKRLWTENGTGDKIRLRRFQSGYEEAEFIANDIDIQQQKGAFDYKDSAVLYRTNAQSRAIEEKLVFLNIPYHIIGGVNFYARKEIKDILAYLKTIDNGADDLSVRRIINIPKRGIGQTTIARVQTYADVNSLSFYEALERAREIPGIGRGSAKLEDFVTFIRSLRTMAESVGVVDLIRNVLERTGYEDELRKEGTDEALDRLANIEELINKAADYAERAGEDRRIAKMQEGAIFGSAADGAGTAGGTESVAVGAALGDTVGTALDGMENSSDPAARRTELSGFLTEVALVADIDSLEDDDNRVPLMTLHSAKGLEFRNVYIAGMDEGLFPSYHSISSEDPSDLEEERRLAYVGITRAKERLTLTSAQSRMTHGETMFYRISRFIDEIPDELLDKGGNALRRRDDSHAGNDGESYKSRAAALRMNTAFQTERRREKAEFHEKPFQSAVQTGAQINAKPGSLDYGVGDTVQHIKFGKGVVQNIRDGGRDFEVTVDFDGFGVKKMFAGFAKLKKV